MSADRHEKWWCCDKWPAEVWEQRAREEEGEGGTGEGVPGRGVETEREDTSSVSSFWFWFPLCPGTQGYVAMLCLVPWRHGHRALVMSGQDGKKRAAMTQLLLRGCWCTTRNIVFNSEVLAVRGALSVHRETLSHVCQPFVTFYIVMPPVVTGVWYDGLSNWLRQLARPSSMLAINL